MIKQIRGMPAFIKFTGRTEGEVRDRLRPILKKGGAAVVYTRRRGKEIQVLAETDEQDEETAKTVIRPAAGEIKRALGDWYYSTKENETLEEAVVRLLMKYDLTVSTAESCTGRNDRGPAGKCGRSFRGVSGGLCHIFQQGETKAFEGWEKYIEGIWSGQ